MIDRLGKMTFQRCQESAHDDFGRELNGESMLWSLTDMGKKFTGMGVEVIGSDAASQLA